MYHSVQIGNDPGEFTTNSGEITTAYDDAPPKPLFDLWVRLKILFFKTIGLGVGLKMFADEPRRPAGELRGLLRTPTTADFRKYRLGRSKKFPISSFVLIFPPSPPEPEWFRTGTGARKTSVRTTITGDGTISVTSRDYGETRNPIRSHQVSIIYGRRITRDFVEYVTTIARKRRGPFVVRLTGKRSFFFIIAFGRFTKNYFLYRDGPRGCPFRTRRPFLGKFTVAAAVWSRIFVFRSYCFNLLYCCNDWNTHSGRPTRVSSSGNVYGPIRFYLPKQYETRVVHTFRPGHKRPGFTGAVVPKTILLFSQRVLHAAVQ